MQCTKALLVAGLCQTYWDLAAFSNIRTGFNGLRTGWGAEWRRERWKGM